MKGVSVLKNGLTARMVHTRSVVLAAIIVFALAIASGCGTRDSSLDSVLTGDAHPPKGSEELLRDLPEATLSRTEALAARDAMREAVVDGEASSPDWLTVLEDGSFTVTGILQGADAWDFGEGERFLVGLKVPEVVGGLRLYHVVPLIATADTSVTYMGERLSIDELLRPAEGSSIDYAGYWVVARFSVQDRWIRAESITYTDDKFSAGAWPDDYPADADLDPWRLYHDAVRKPAPDRVWLDVRSNRGSFDLEGYLAGWLSAGSEGHDFGGSIDVTVPDHLGSAAIYHVAQVLFEKPSDATEALLIRLNEQKEDPGMLPLMSSYSVSLVENRLVLVGASP